MNQLRRASSVLFAVMVFGCSAAQQGADAGLDAGHVHFPVTSIAFKARVGTRDFACGQRYVLGTTGTSYRPQDFRLYVHDVALITEYGTSVPFELADDGVWQRREVAMLDFEDGTGECSNGTAAMHTTLEGFAYGAHYQFLEFTLGVPFALNHQDATRAPPPLNSSAMFWSWQGGYKFLRIDGLTAGLPMGTVFHLGSTGCTPGALPNSVETCAAPNRVRISVPRFDPDDAEARTVVFDLERLFVGSNLDVNAPGTAEGCMSTPGDDECAPLFQRVGLPFDGVAGDPERQTFVRLE